MDLQLKNKVVLITGGASGIGAAISEIFVAEGARVAIASRNSRGNKEFADQLGNAEKVLFIEVELTDTEACKAAVEQTVEHFGQLDVLVNNAGVNDGASLESGPEAFRASLAANIGHVYDLAHYALPHLKATKGNILNVGSKVADTGQGGTSGYAASKGAMNALTREWALDFAPLGLRCNCVIPAEVYTPLYERWLSSLDDPAAEKAKIENTIPLERRMTSSEELANMCVFLSSPVSSHTTGQIVYVDGGYTHLDRACTSKG